MKFCEICFKEVKNEMFLQNNVCSAKCNRELLEKISERKGQTKLDDLKWISS